MRANFRTLSKSVLFSLFLGASALVLFFPQGAFAQGSAAAQGASAEKPSGKAAMGCPCAEMMAKHHKEKMAMKKEMDERLDAKVAEMNSAKGENRVEAMAAVLNELVAQRKEMHQRHNKMREHMMDMKKSGAMGSGECRCPMMREGSGE